MNHRSGDSNEMPALLSETADAASVKDSRGRSLLESINNLVAEHYEPLLRYLSLTCWNAALSQEIAQEAFLRLHKEFMCGSTIQNPKSWLFRVAHNLVIDHARSPRTEHSLSDEDVTRRVERRFQQSTSNPELQLLERERLHRLHKAVSSLPAAQRHALYLRREGFPYREIAVILQMGETTAMDHVRRAIDRLHQELHDARL